MIPLTQIKLRTSDQHLITSQKVRIAAGDINSVVLHVEFDSHWGEFTERKALFVNDAANSSDTQDILLIGDECIVPHEVLAKDGILSISVTGYTADGAAKKTSSIVRMKVHESLTDASTTVEPTMDLYMQYLAAIHEEINPIATQFHNKINAMLSEKIAEMEAVVEEQRQWMQGDVLWVNPEPGATIDNPITIEFDRTAYTRLHVMSRSRSSEGNDTWLDCLCIHENGDYRIHADTDSDRPITVSDTGIVIGKYSSGSAYSAIPYKIIGYKY